MREQLGVVFVRDVAEDMDQQYRAAGQLFMIAADDFSDADGRPDDIVGWVRSLRRSSPQTPGSIGGLTRGGQVRSSTCMTMQRPSW